MKLRDRYTLRGEIGRGGMATVHRAVDTTLGREVAVKVLAHRYAGDPRFVERFRREAQAAASLNHPNVVSVYDTGDQGGAHFIVMELVEGETLAQVLKREGRLSPERSARVAAEAARTLQVAHDRGIIHRDVKPANIMLTPRGEVKVMDFGIARAAEEDHLTQTGMVLGTARYLSPEQSRGDPVDARSDVYSLGCVLHEMLTGSPPFTGETPVAIAYKHVHEEPAPPSATVPGIPREMDAVVMRALEKDPDRRFLEGRALGEALGAAGSGVPTEPIHASGDTAVLPVGETEHMAVARGPTRLPRRWALPAAAAVAFLVAAGATYAVVSGGGEDPRARDALRREAPAERIPTVTEALAIFRSTVADAVGAATVTEELGRTLLEEARRIGEEHARGNVVTALEHGGKAHEEVDAGLAEGEVTGPDTAESLHAALDLVGLALEADAAELPREPSPTPEETGSEGDGGRGEENGEGEDDD